MNVIVESRSRSGLPSSAERPRESGAENEGDAAMPTQCNVAMPTRGSNQKTGRQSDLTNEFKSPELDRRLTRLMPTASAGQASLIFVAFLDAAGRV